MGGKDADVRAALTARAESPRHTDNLRALFFENVLGLFSGGLLLAIGAGYVTEGNRLSDRSKFPERTLALSNSVGIRATADERSFRGHVMLSGMPGMLRQVKHLRIVGDAARRLPNGGCGA